MVGTESIEPLHWKDRFWFSRELSIGEPIAVPHTSAELTEATQHRAYLLSAFR
jgi:hypothetical protein